MKTAIYIRVSTEEQAKEGYSISAQKQRLKAFCIAQDWDVSGMYVDEGISAKNMKRPQLQQMIKDVEAGNIDCVLVYRLDRLTRSVLDLYKLLEIFEKYDCKFKSATEVYDTTTAMGRMFITIVAALAQWERENMGERISMGYAEKVRQGKYALNFRPFGYNLDLKTGQLSIKEDEAKTVRLIFELYIKGYGGSRICKYLNERNITTKAGNKWNDKPLMQIIKNPLYRGAIRWNDFVVENTHPPIITKEVFEAVQQLIIKRRTTEPRRVSSDYIFTGKVKCEKCGNPMVGKKTAPTKLASGETKKYKFYRCIKGKTGECTGSLSVSETKLEDAFLEYLEKQDFSQVLNEVGTAGEQILNKPIEPVSIDKEALEKELEKIQKRKKKWQYAWANELGLSDEDFMKRMDEANKEEDAIQLQLVSLETLDEGHNERLFNKDEIMDALINIRNNWYVLETMEKKQLVDSIIEQIHYKVIKKGTRNYATIEGIDFY